MTALAPELASVAEELADAEVRPREAASTLRSYLDGLDADHGRVDAIEGDLERISETKRRFRVSDFAEPSARPPRRAPSGGR